MKKNVVYFTNLGIVKSNDFELTNEYFFSTMKREISNNPNKFYVTKNEENNEYNVVFKGEPYRAILGKDGYLETKEIVDYLDELVDLSNKIKGIRQEEDKKNIYDKQRRKEIFDMAEAGIIETNEEKIAKIDILKNKYKKNGYKVFKNVWEVFKSLNLGKKRDNIYVDIFGFAIGAGIGVCSAEIFGNYLIGAIFCSIACVSLLSMFLDITIPYYRGIWGTLLSIITLPFSVIYHGIKKLIYTINCHREINNIKKTITKTKKEELKSKINDNELNKYLSEETINELKNRSVDYSNTILVINDIKDKINLINDEKISNNFKRELYEIVKYYTDASMNIKRKDYLSQILSNQLVDLNRRVEEKIREEEYSRNNDCDNLIEEINQQKSIGAR